MSAYETKRRLSAQKFGADSVGEAPAETTPPNLTPSIVSFAAGLGDGTAQFVPVMADAYGLYGWCADGVLEKVKNDGGDIRYGWTIWEWPGVLLTAEFHAVWTDQSNALIDVTPKPHGEKQILFVPDSSVPSDFNFDDRPLNRRRRLYLPPDRSGEIAAQISRMKPAQRKYEEGRAAKAGASLEKFLLDKRPVDQFMLAVDEFIRVCDEFDKEIETAGRGTISLTGRLRDLFIQKMKLQERIKRGP